MEIEKVHKENQKDVSPTVAYYYNFKGRSMVHISGNFVRGGFSLSKNKVAAILANIRELQEFALGNYDDQILRLLDDEVLKSKGGQGAGSDKG